jgi:hypothetical protein
MRNFLLLIITGLLSAQTTVSPVQVRPTVAVVEWAKCTFTSANAGCVGMELYRFRMSDGSLRGPFFAVPAPAGFVVDAKWQPQPLQ